MLFCKGSALRTFAVALLAVASVPVFGQVVPGSGDVSAHIGFNNLSGVDGDKHVQFGFTGGVNLTSHAALVGEYTYLPQGSVTFMGAKAGAHYQNIGAAVRFSFLSKDRFVPYGVAAGGYSRLTATGSYGGYSASESANGLYFGLGGGASYYVASNWGVRPEVRWDIQRWSKDGGSGHRNDVRGIVAVFYQFGGRSR